VELSVRTGCPRLDYYSYQDLLASVPVLVLLCVVGDLTVASPPQIDVSVRGVSRISTFSSPTK